MLLKTKFTKYLLTNKIPYKEENDTIFVKIKGNENGVYELYINFDDENIYVGLASGLVFDEKLKLDVFDVINEINSFEDNYIKFTVNKNIILAQSVIPYANSSVDFMKIERFLLDFVETLEVYLKDIYEVIE